MTLNISVTDEQLGKFFRRICAIAERLCRLYPDEEIWISTTTGKKTIAQSVDVFKGWVDPDFKKWGTDKFGKPAEKTKVEIHEMKKDATFEQMFTSLGDVDKLCFGQEQIISFCLEHSDRLRKEGCGNFFLFKVEGFVCPFVAHVRLDTDGLSVNVYHFDFGLVWDGGGRRRVVVPQILEG